MIEEAIITIFAVHIISQMKILFRKQPCVLNNEKGKQYKKW